MKFYIKFKKIDGYVFWDSDENWKQFKESQCARVFNKLFKLGFMFTTHRHKTIEDVWRARSEYSSSWDTWNFALVGVEIDGCKKRIQLGVFDSYYIRDCDLIVNINTFIVIYRTMQFAEFIKRSIDKFFELAESNTIPSLYYTDELSPYIQSPYASNIQYPTN